MAYDIFISYSLKDRAIAYKICKTFDSVGITYFIDRQGIGGDFESPEVLTNAILDSKKYCTWQVRTHINQNLPIQS